MADADRDALLVEHLTHVVGVDVAEREGDRRAAVLGRGGALDADEMLVNFLGREPSNEAFLEKLGIEGTE